MPSYFETEEFQQLQHQRTALMYSCGNLRRSDDPEVRLIDQKIADGRWHFENPGLTGSWRIAFNGVAMDGYGIPRFETEAAALAYIGGEIGHYPNVGAVYLPTRQTLDAKTAKYPVAA